MNNKINIKVIQTWDAREFELMLSSMLSKGCELLHINALVDPQGGYVDQPICLIAVLQMTVTPNEAKQGE